MVLGQNWGRELIINHSVQTKVNSYGLSGRLESIENELRYLRDENTALKKEAAVREAKLQANIRSIKTFWSPELKKERNARKEEQLRAGL